MKYIIEAKEFKEMEAEQRKITALRKELLK